MILLKGYFTTLYTLQEAHGSMIPENHSLLSHQRKWRYPWFYQRMRGLSLQRKSP